MLKQFIQLWLQDPKFSLKVFVTGLIVFFVGVALIFIGQLNSQLLLTAGWSVLVTGVFIALPGYIGIWRWRWIQFKNDK